MLVLEVLAVAMLLGKQQVPEPEQSSSDKNTARSTTMETVTADSANTESQKMIVSSLPSSNEVDKSEWRSDPLPEDGNDGLRISLRSSDTHQVDGATDKVVEEVPEGIEQRVKENETQMDVFVKVDKIGGLLEPYLPLLYNIPPATVDHPVWGIGKYHSTEDYKEYKTTTMRKAHCYRL